MAATIVTVKLAGFTSATSSVAPTGGTALGSLLSVQILDDGGIIFTDSGSNVRKLNYSAELHALLALLTVGTNGVASGKKWNKD